MKNVFTEVPAKCTIHVHFFNDWSVIAWKSSMMKRTPVVLKLWLQKPVNRECFIFFNNITQRTPHLVDIYPRFDEYLNSQNEFLPFVQESQDEIFLYLVVERLWSCCTFRQQILISFLISAFVQLIPTKHLFRVEQNTNVGRCAACSLMSSGILQSKPCSKRKKFFPFLRSKHTRSAFFVFLRIQDQQNCFDNLNRTECRVCYLEKPITLFRKINDQSTLFKEIKPMK